MRAQHALTACEAPAAAVCAHVKVTLAAPAFFSVPTQAVPTQPQQALSGCNQHEWAQHQRTQLDEAHCQ